MVDSSAEPCGAKEIPKSTGPGYRSKVKAKEPSEVAKFPDMPYEEGGTAKVNGARGVKILTIHKKFPDGKYQMKDGNKILSKIYNEADLSPATDLV